MICGLSCVAVRRGRAVSRCVELAGRQPGSPSVPGEDMKMSAADGFRYRGVEAAKRHRNVISLGAFAEIICLAAALHLAFWAIKDPRASAPAVEDRLPSLSYNRFASSSSEDSRISEDQIRTDLTAIAAQAKAVRTYASTGGLEFVPQVVSAVLMRSCHQ